MSLDPDTMIRVLIIDDSLFMRTIIKDMLEKDREIEVVGTANNGEEGLLKIKDLAPDIVTLDIEMPKMDGLELLRQIGNITPKPKILMLSSLTSKGAMMTQNAMNLGADDFMLKPKDIARIRGIERELIDKIKNIVRISYISRKPPVFQEIAKNIVLIGSSAGGPPMLDILLSSFGTGIPAAVMITQHMPEGGFTAALATRLNRLSPMPVKETESGDLINSGQVYVAKAGYHSIISTFVTASEERGGKIIHSRSAPLHSVRPAVDRTFISAATTFGPHTVSVLLSGMGIDGGEGTFAVKQQGGITFVTREEDCLVYGMARAALERNCVDSVVPIRSMADEIRRVLHGMAG
jgi:two-component system chemotaxis response regulator CheB